MSECNYNWRCISCGEFQPIPKGQLLVHECAADAPSCPHLEYVKSRFWYRTLYLVRWPRQATAPVIVRQWLDRDYDTLLCVCGCNLENLAHNKDP